MLRWSRGQLSEPHTLPCLFLQVEVECAAHACRGTHAQENPAYMLRRHWWGERARNLAKIWAEFVKPTKIRNGRDKMGVQIGTSIQRGLYSNWNNLASKIIPQGMKPPERERVAHAVKELRNSLGFSQEQMGIAMGVTQGLIAKWERGSHSPSGQAFAAMARLAPSDTKDFWMELAGFTKEDDAEGDDSVIRIPVLRDPSAAGTPRAIDESEISERILLPRGWLPQGGSLQALRVRGDSMMPVLLDGFIVVIDTAQRNPVSLDQHIVAARNEEGEVTIKRLQHAQGIYCLVPERPSAEFAIGYLKPHGDFSIVGKVVKWIGEPQAPPKKR